MQKNSNSFDAAALKAVMGLAWRRRITLTPAQMQWLKRSAEAGHLVPWIGGRMSGRRTVKTLVSDAVKGMSR